MKKLSELTLTDLLLLHNNYTSVFFSSFSGSRFELLNKHEFEAVEKELQKRLNQIDFKI